MLTEPEPEPEAEPEPEPAAAHYARSDHLDPGALVAVYDLGGGTFDATVLRTAGHGFDILGHLSADTETTTAPPTTTSQTAASEPASSSGP